MRKRHQKGSLTKVDGCWIAQWWQDGRRRKKTLGRTSQVTKAQAQLELAAIVSPINAKAREASPLVGFSDFVKEVYLPFYRRRWKRSTAMTNEDRLRLHLCNTFGNRSLGTFTRDDLQTMLEHRAAVGHSFSTLDHLRWDLRQIFEMAVAENYIARNPARLLFTPRPLKRYEARIMNMEEVKRCLEALDSRERLIAELAILAGMRPGEILGLKWGTVQDDHVDVRIRVYKGDVDIPKTNHSLRRVALPTSLACALLRWREDCQFVEADDWVFVSENRQKPLRRDNLWRREIGPRLKAAGLEWATFQVMRRTHSSLMNELQIDPKIVADQLGHTLDVNQNVYTKAALHRRVEAVNLLERALRNP